MSPPSLDTVSRDSSPDSYCGPFQDSSTGMEGDWTTVLRHKRCRSRRSSSDTGASPPAKPIKLTPTSKSDHPDELVVIFQPRTDSELKISTPASRARALRDLVGDVSEARLLRSGCLVIHCYEKKQVDILLQSSTFVDIEVSPRQPARLRHANTGVICGVSPDTTDAEVDAAIGHLVTAFNRLSRRDPSGNLVPTWSIKALFITMPPDSIKINYQNCKVRPFVPAPKRCFNCQRYGHLAANCRSDTRCGKCSSNHPTKECPDKDDLRCALCNSNQPVWHQDCPFKLRAREVERLHTIKKLSYADALKQVKHVKPDTPPTTRPTCSFSTQTEPAILKDAESNTELDFTSISEETETRLFTLDSDRCIIVFTIEDLTEFFSRAVSILKASNQAGESNFKGRIIKLALDDFF